MAFYAFNPYPNRSKDKKRAQCGATLEVLPKLFGFKKDVTCRAVDVDYARNIVRFFFAGDGLEEIEVKYNVDLTAHEGQESPEITPPAWEDDKIKETNV